MSLGPVYHKIRTYVLVCKWWPVLTASGGAIPHCASAAPCLPGELGCNLSHLTSGQSTCGLQPQGACKLRKMKPQVGGSRRAATVVCKSPAGKRQTLDVEFGRCIELDCAVRTLAPANERTHHELPHQPAISARRAPHDPGATRYVARGVPPIRHQMGG